MALIFEYLAYAYGPVTRIIAPLYAGKIAENKSDLLAAVPQVHAELERFQGELAGSAWFGGEAVAAAVMRTVRTAARARMRLAHCAATT